MLQQADRLTDDTHTLTQRTLLCVWCRWHELQGALDLYRSHLAGALEVHAFNRDVDDTSQRVAEKAVAMNTEDVGRDLMAVEQLQRKQEALERDMTAIEGKLKVQLQYRLMTTRCLWHSSSLLFTLTVQLLESNP
jgi:hypothetical protein